MENKKEREYRSMREMGVRRLAVFGAENIAYALYDSTAWSNSVDYIFPIYDSEWHITGMKVGLLNFATGEYFEPLVFTEKQNFLDFIAEIIAADEKKHPDTQKYHKLMLEKFAKFVNFK